MEPREKLPGLSLLYPLRAQVKRGLSGGGTDHAVHILQQRFRVQMLTPRMHPEMFLTVSASLS